MTDLGVIVAGGAGARLGAGVPKAQAMLAGETLLERAIATLAAVCDPIVVVTPGDRRPDTTVKWVEDAEPLAGPLAGLVAGLRSEPYTRALVVGVDFPLLCAGFLAALLDELDASGAPAVLTAPGGTPQPLLAAFAPRAAAELERALERGERSVTRAVMELGPRVLDDTRLAAMAGGFENLVNVNTPEDLAAVERTLQQRGPHDVADPGAGDA